MENLLQYKDKWSKQKKIDSARIIANKIIEYLDSKNVTPKRILDIGAGFAYTSNFLQQHYSCEIYIIESDFETTKENTRKNLFGPSDNFKFYLPLDILHEQWQSQGLDYKFIDANNLTLNNDIKFDLVTSYLSCGYHYPLNTYRDFIMDHCTEDYFCIYDIRNKSFKKQNNNIEVINWIENRKSAKRSKLCFRYLNQLSTDNTSPN